MITDSEMEAGYLAMEREWANGAGDEEEEEDEDEEDFESTLERAQQERERVADMREDGWLDSLGD